MGREPRKVSCLLAKWAGWDREKYDRADGIGEVVCGWSTWGVLFLLARL